MKQFIGLISFSFFLFSGISAQNDSTSQSDSTTCSCLFIIDSTFHIVPMTMGWDPGIPPYYQNNNAATPGIALPFNFCFYDLPVDSIYICNNGIVTINYPIYPFIIQGGFPLGEDSLVIAPFFADVNDLVAASGYVWYKITPTYMVVIWDSVRYYGTDVDGWDYFQLIISNGTDPIIPGGNNVEYCYGNMQWTCGDSSGFYTGFNGVPATVGVNRGDGINYAQVATFNQPGTQYYGPYQQDDGVDWLYYSTFILNTCQQGVNIPPVVFDYYRACDTFMLCSGDSIDVLTMYICPEQVQTVTFSATCPGVSTISIADSSSINIIDSVTIALYPAIGDTGIHVLNVTATDNFGLTSTIPYIIVVKNCTEGIKQITAHNGFIVYPIPNSGIFNVEFSNSQSPINCEAKVYDVLGNEIYSSSLNASINVVNLSDKAKGIYFLEVFKDGLFIGVDKIIIL